MPEQQSQISAHVSDEAGPVVGVVVVLFHVAATHVNEDRGHDPRLGRLLVGLRPVPVGDHPRPELAPAAVWKAARLRHDRVLAEADEAREGGQVELVLVARRAGR